MVQENDATGGRLWAVRWMLILGVFMLMPGCQVWNAWLDAWKWKGPDGQEPAPGRPLMVTTPPQARPPEMTMLTPRVTIHRITVPVGTFSGNEQIWIQLNEDALDSQATVLLAQNGMRAATGSLARWSAIAQLLDAPGATSDQLVVQTDGRSPVNVVTRPNVTQQIVVSIDRDLKQRGRTFERCDNAFRLSLRGARNAPELQVQLEPIVTLGTVQVVRTGAELGLSRTGFTAEETFGDLRVAATLTAEQFLVISAMDPLKSPYSVGTLWLSDPTRVPPMETILVLVPAVQRAGEEGQ